MTAKLAARMAAFGGAAQKTPKSSGRKSKNLRLRAAAKKVIAQKKKPQLDAAVKKLMKGAFVCVATFRHTCM